MSLTTTTHRSAVIAVLILFGLMACNQQANGESSADVSSEVASDASELSDDSSKLGYTIGLQIASGLKGQGLDKDISLDALKLAIDDVFGDKEPRMTDVEMQAAQLAYQQKLQAELAAISQANKEAGEKYLAENANVDGVKSTESGLQYVVEREGKGAKPTATDTVKVHYSGKLVDGTEFDSSYTRGTPAEFPVAGVIPGFSEGLQLMSEGAKYTFYIPSDDAYGANAPPTIGPNQVLVFDVELIEVLNQTTEKKEG